MRPHSRHKSPALSIQDLQRAEEIAEGIVNEGASQVRRTADEQINQRAHRIVEILGCSIALRLDGCLIEQGIAAAKIASPPWARWRPGASILHPNRALLSSNSPFTAASTVNRRVH